MSFGTLTGAMTSGIDMFVGGQLTKAELEVEDEMAAEYNGLKLVFQFNPETIKINRYQSTTQTSSGGTEGTRPRQGAVPLKDSKLVINNLIFDTYEEKPSKNVYEEYIEKLEKMLSYDPGKHAPCQLVFTWGKFTESFSGNRRLTCWLASLDTEYTMFLNDGTPCRAKVNMTLDTGPRPEDAEEQHSPDHAKLHVVKRGDTLADIAAVEYDNPGEWRRIANANEIDDPLAIQPGMKLIVPPILS